MSNPYTKRQWPFAVLILIVLTVFFLDRSVQHGLFLDGLIYASISRNMAIGDGSFWSPHYTGGFPFWSHPPLMFGLEAIFFKIFGSFYGTEKIFSFCVWLTSLLLIIRNWKHISSDPAFRSMYWLPVLLWGFMPSVLWAYPNNILDPLVGLFGLAAVAVLFKGLQSGQGMGYLLSATMLIFCASLTKGLPGIFPVIVPVLYWWAYKRQTLQTALKQSAILLILISCIYLLLYIFPGPRAYLNSYMATQVLSSLNGMNDVNDSIAGRFSVLTMILTELVIIIAIGLIIYILHRVIKTNKQPVELQKQHSIFFLLVGLSASLPLMISVKVRSFYLVPALPYFAIAAGIIIYAWLLPLTQRFTLSHRYMGIIKGTFVFSILAALVIMYLKAGTIGRDEEMVHDARSISRFLPNEHVAVPQEVNDNYELLAYLQRYGRIDAYRDRKLGDARYFIADAQMSNACYLWRASLNHYKQTKLPVNRYIVYRKGE